ncbi:uncharacterized protein [Haliotis asinina]|uniref:uncharacterized protein n=1 Tax=Haliotis asinina TaxID=109174 RepID=UPI0035322DED
MIPHLSLTILLMILETGLAIDFSKLKLNAPTTESREQMNAGRAEKVAKWEEAIANITADIEELEALKDTGFPTLITAAVTDNPNTEGSSSAQEGKIFTGKPEEFSGRSYAGYLRDREGDDVSGLCASRVHPGILYYVNDRSSYESYVHVIDIRNHGQRISKIHLQKENVDWEDMACGPCSLGSEEYCIHVLDAGSSGPGPVHKIYSFKEPEDISTDQDAEGVVTTSFSSTTSNCETLMVSPTGRIFIMDSVSSSYVLYEVIGDETKYLFEVSLWSSSKGPKSGDISPDGKGFVFKMLDRIYYFYVEDESEMETILTSSTNRMKVPYLEEDYATSISWSLSGESFLTVSEGINEIIYEYKRVN